MWNHDRQVYEISSKSFPELLKQCDSDCWNDGHIVRKTLKACPETIRIDIEYRGTGLFCDVIAVQPNGLRLRLRLRVERKYKFLKYY